MPDISPVTVWQINWRALSSAQTAAARRHLTAPELIQAARFAQPDDRARFSLARGLLRVLSARQLGLAPAALPLRTEERGKPFWEGHRDRLEVNVSHSGDWLALGFSTGVPLGVDVQEMRPGVDMSGVSRLSMHPSEQAWLSEGAGQDAAFYTLWTLREAALKATGDGFFAHRTVLNTLPCPLAETWSRRDYGDGVTLDLRPLPAANGYSAALALVSAPNAPPPPAPRCLNGGDLPELS